MTFNQNSARMTSKNLFKQVFQKLKKKEKKRRKAIARMMKINVPKYSKHQSRFINMVMTIKKLENPLVAKISGRF